MDLVVPEECRLAVPGGEIYVCRWRASEASAKAPILLLHDSLGCVALWRDFPSRLQQCTGRDVIAYDRLGFGQSSPRVEPPSAHFIDEEAEMIFPVLCDALGLESLVVMGHSVGGCMTVAIAGTHADSGRCRAIISESAQTYIEEQTRSGVAAAKQEFSDPVHFNRLEKYHGSKARWVLDAWTETWLNPDFSDWSLRPQLEKVRCPVLAIHGDRDEYGSVAFAQLIVSAVGGQSRSLIIDGVGHVPHKEAQAQVVHAIADFLQQVDGS